MGDVHQPRLMSVLSHMQQRRSQGDALDPAQRSLLHVGAMIAGNGRTGSVIGLIRGLDDIVIMLA